jgi:HEAT repeat protein
MHESRHILNVFLASPNDVGAERMAAEEVVQSINGVIGRQLGWHIELHKWEDSTPGFGRPQGIINEMVDSCRLFIGLLWKHWGQPSGTYSSGFEEEFERAKTRRKESGEPEIWLVFKSLDPDELDDAGPQLTKVLEFRQSQVTLREVLFHEVRSTEDWKTRLDKWLLEYVLRLAQAAQIQRPSSTAVPVLEPGGPQIEVTSTGSDETKISQQLLRISSIVSQVVRSDNLEFSRDETKLLQEFDVVRLFLLSATWMSRRYTGDVFGPHEMNLLYKHREQLEPTVIELSQLLRTLVGQGYDLIPGWFWFRELSSEAVTNWLLTLANQDSSDNVRTQALTLLVNAKIRPAADVLSRLPLQDESLRVRSQAYEYLVREGDESALSLFEALSTDTDEVRRSSINEARLRLMARLQPSKALSEVITKGEYLSNSEMDAIKQNISQVDEDVLLTGAKGASAQVRRLSLKELARRGHLPMEVAQGLRHDPSIDVRALALQCLAKHGQLTDLQEVRKLLSKEEPASESGMLSLSMMLERRKSISPDAESIIVTFYRTQSAEQLLQAIDWYSVDGPLAYEALALDRYNEVATHVRTDLLQGFARVKEQSTEQMKSELGPEAWGKYAPRLERFDDSTQAHFTKAALSALAANGEASDAEFARPYLSDSNTSVRDAAVIAISRFGSSEDVDALMNITKEAWGDVRRTAAAAALRLSPTPLQVAYDLSENSDSEVVEIAFGWFFAQDSPEVKTMFLKLLQNDAEPKRMRAIYYWSQKMTNEELRQLLQDYISAETYYYDVVTWLDRLLYSPQPLREMFVRQLSKEAKAANKEEPEPID